MTSVAIILAAGHSRRFGPENKLRANFRGKPLITHAISLVEKLPVDDWALVCRDPLVAAMVPEQHRIQVSDKDQLQSDSLRAGVTWAKAKTADRLLILLGDMPLITPDHVLAVIAQGKDLPGASIADGKIMPPAVFPSRYFDDLIALQGDKGAGALLRGLPKSHYVPLDKTGRQDIDCEADLAL